MNCKRHIFFGTFFQLFLCCTLLLVCQQALAFDPGDRAPESDVGLAAQSIPASNELEIPTLTITAVTGEPKIDGHIDDDFWAQAKSFELDIELYPERLAPARVKTEAFVAATKTHIYVAFKAHDPHPERIRSALRERDASKEDDYVSIIIDPTGSLSKKYELRLNPDGTLSDVLQDTISDRYIYDWDGEWEGAAQRTESGYTAEFAIPAGSIRVPEKVIKEGSKGVVILKRSYPRRVDTTLATFFYFKRPVFGEGGTTQSLSGIDLIDPKKRLINMIPGELSLKAHYIYHMDEARDIGEGEGDFEQEDDRDVHSFGLDAEYKFSTSKTLSLTLNPNFSEVEADIAKQSINQPFSIFQPEKRDFFKSVTEYYSHLIPIVYTRNIINPSVGMSYVGDNGKHSINAFAVDDRETEVIVPDNLSSDKVELLESSYSAAFRYRHAQHPNTWGISGTIRGNDDEYHNALLSVDGLMDLGPDDKFRYQFSYSDSIYPKNFAEDLCEDGGCTDEPPPEPCYLGDCSVNAEVLRTDYGNQLKGHGLQFRYKHDGPEGLYWAGYEQYSPDYRADMGFVRRIDIRSLNVAYGKKWYLKTLEDDDGKSRIRGYVIGKYMRSYEYDDLLERGISFWAEFRGSYQSVIRAGYRIQDRAVNRINQASLDTGDNAPLFDERYFQWYYETSPLTYLTINFDGRIGDIADADNMVLGFMLEFKPKLTYRYGPLEFIAAGTFRDFKLDGEPLYKEQFLSFTALYRSSKQFSHRLLYLDDLTQRDIERWLDKDEPAEEFERTFEYTFTYQPAETWEFLFGVKAEYEYESNIDDGDWTAQQVYCKVEKTF
jgi:hypothetical protein